LGAQVVYGDADVLWRSQCRWALECRQAGRRDAAARQIRVCQERVSMVVLADIKRRRMRCDVMRDVRRVQQCLATLDSSERRLRCGAVLRARARRAGGWLEWWQAGWQRFRVAAQPKRLLQPFEKRQRTTIPARLIAYYGDACIALWSHLPSSSPDWLCCITPTRQYPGHSRANAR